jgi:hypothetical protein
MPDPVVSATKADPKKPYKAIAAAIVTLAAYLVGVIPAEGGFGDVSVVQWLGAVVFLGSAYGLTYSVSNPVVSKT